MRNGRGRSPTIIDVAKLAGVSKSTAARALSGSANISQASREAVLRAAATTGYERNHLAVGMRSGRSGMLGLVIPDITNPFWAEVARGAQDEAADVGLSLLVFSSDWDHAREVKHLQTVRRARVEGVVINPVSDGVDDFSRLGMPLVLIGSSAERFPDIASVGSDIAQGVRLGLDHLVSKGHAAPALIVGPRSRLARARFLRVVYDHCLERDIDPAVLPIEEGEYTVEGGRHAMQRLLARARVGPLAVFAANDLMALGAMMAVRESGLDCPGDVSILGFDGVPAGAFTTPGLTTVEKPGRLMGARAVARLVDAIARRPGYGRAYLPCRLLERGSIADLAAAGRLGLAVART